VNRTIVTLTAVVALTLAACTTEDTRGWSDEAFRDLTGYCQAAELSNCASILILIRDTLNCSVEATYKIVDFLDSDEQGETLADFVNDVLQGRKVVSCAGMRATRIIREAVSTQTCDHFDNLTTVAEPSSTVCDQCVAIFQTPSKYAPADPLNNSPGRS